ncbi:short-chain dehydrogenase reductase ATA1 [Telopea speciosissima]|uniref:short-chain dehydrogenase reductase ATA1 n=1 Tax=Telopea speciosissima TaxID=54955 RepID=UPI001CC5A159|nr:short-chain dehydrogenase reductase ATA1 [Telopea speciosissima]
MSSNFRLKGKVTIITGGARGIGATTAKLFALNGAHVIIADILDEIGTSLAESIDGRYIHCDVAKESDVESAVQLALTWKGHLDIMFNNAGISGMDGSIANLDMDKLNGLLAVNVNGMVHGIKQAARAMIKAQSGCIICTSSSAALMGGLGSHGYSLSKEAILGLAKSAACELGMYGIRVNCISPHGIPSEMLVDGYRYVLKEPEMSLDDLQKRFTKKDKVLRGRNGSMEDVAQAALFLASDEAGFITGHNLVIDGGFTTCFTELRLMYQ